MDKASTDSYPEHCDCVGLVKKLALILFRDETAEMEHVAYVLLNVEALSLLAKIRIHRFTLMDELHAFDDVLACELVGQHF